MNNPILHELTDKEVPINLSKMNKHIEKEKKKLEKPKVSGKEVFGKEYKDPFKSKNYNNTKKIKKSKYTQLNNNINISTY